MPATSRSFLAASSVVPDTRRFLREMLREWGEDGYDFGGSLVLTELVTNVVLHARTPYEVRLVVQDGLLMIEVHDGHAQLPRRRHYEADATTGRGMLLVSQLCSGWGVREVDRGKVVWAHVRPDSMISSDPTQDAEADVLSLHDRSADDGSGVHLMTARAA